MSKIDVRVETMIATPRSEVAAVMFDPKHDAEWTSGVLEVHPHAEGRLRRGSRVVRKVKFAMKTFNYEYLVVGAEDDRWVELEVEEPFPMHIRYELIDVAEGTVATIHTHGDATGFFKIGGPILKIMVRRNIRKDLASLKALVETR